MAVQTFDPVRSEAFCEKLVGSLNQSALMLMISIGHRTRLFDVMAQLPASTSTEIAEAAGLSERYVREWLGSMVTGGVVEHDPDEARFSLPVEHAAWLTRAASPNNIGASAQWVSVLGTAEDAVVEAFRHGQGVPYAAYPRFHEVMAEESEQTVVAALMEHILPLAPGLSERLRQGIRVLDIGCGRGRALQRLASEFPRSQFVGYDFSPEAIEGARREAGARGLENLRFAVQDAAEIDDPKAFDLITGFDVIHDQARPAQVLKNIAAALRPGGLFLMQDISGSSHLHTDCKHPFGPFLYAISCMHCMSVSLANGGPGLGAMWGKETALRMLEEAGFKEVRVEQLPHDPLNFYFLASTGK